MRVVEEKMITTTTTTAMDEMAVVDVLVYMVGAWMVDVAGRVNHLCHICENAVLPHQRTIITVAGRETNHTLFHGHANGPVPFRQHRRRHLPPPTPRTTLHPVRPGAAAAALPEDDRHARVGNGVILGVDPRHLGTADAKAAVTMIETDDGAVVGPARSPAPNLVLDPEVAVVDRSLTLGLVTAAVDKRRLHDPKRATYGFQRTQQWKVNRPTPRKRRLTVWTIRVGTSRRRMLLQRMMVAEERKSPSTQLLVTNIQEMRRGHPGILPRSEVVPANQIAVATTTRERESALIAIDQKVVVVAGREAAANGSAEKKVMLTIMVAIKTTESLWRLLQHPLKNLLLTLLLLPPPRNGRTAKRAREGERSLCENATIDDVIESATMIGTKTMVPPKRPTVKTPVQRRRGQKTKTARKAMNLGTNTAAATTPFRSTKATKRATSSSGAKNGRRNGRG